MGGKKRDRREDLPRFVESKLDRRNRREKEIKMLLVRMSTRSLYLALRAEENEKESRGLHTRYIAMKSRRRVMGHLLFCLFVCAHHSLICLFHTACFKRFTVIIRSLAPSLTLELMEKRRLLMM